MSYGARLEVDSRSLACLARGQQNERIEKSSELLAQQNSGRDVWQRETREEGATIGGADESASGAGAGSRSRLEYEGRVLVAEIFRTNSSPASVQLAGGCCASGLPRTGSRSRSREVAERYKDRVSLLVINMFFQFSFRAGDGAGGLP